MAYAPAFEIFVRSLERGLLNQSSFDGGLSFETAIFVLKKGQSSGRWSWTKYKIRRSNPWYLVNEAWCRMFARLASLSANPSTHIAAWNQSSTSASPWCGCWPSPIAGRAWRRLPGGQAQSSSKSDAGSKWRPWPNPCCTSLVGIGRFDVFGHSIYDVSVLGQCPIGQIEREVAVLVRPSRPQFCFAFQSGQDEFSGFIEVLFGNNTLLAANSKMPSERAWTRVNAGLERIDGWQWMRWLDHARLTICPE